MKFEEYVGALSDTVLQQVTLERACLPSAVLKRWSTWPANGWKFSSPSAPAVDGTGEVTHFSEFDSALNAANRA